ncbi:uncharacterized protein BYT42DRAFT_578916 [Radiomyces spectabilis]|uniref:uncharacterized protein n=1 Tax=Radiomyces spectabilis TaxID=64574 RepID=UPI00221F78D0|nr:uncharacterized protein BYT42DRAFT_578916 [Radiomyces spectabilis]KAI8373011.1 hypothetical protein BYT42DRAFT_578916 [Radiomyces spectabilis]
MSKAERRAEHNAIERARRENLNGKFLQLAEALPNLQGRRRPSKGQIVDKALDWVKRCAAKESRYQYHLLQLQRENKRLTAQLNLTRTEASGITPPLPDPSLTSPHPFPRYPTTEDSSAHLWLSSQHTTTATVTGGATAAAAAAAATSVNMMTMNQVTPYPLSRPQWRFDEDYDDDDNSSVLEDPNQFGLTFSHDMSPHPSSYSLDHVYSHDWNNPKDSFHHSLPRYEASMEYSVPLIVHGP